MKTLLLTDGPGVFGVGNSEEEAIADALANCLDPADYSRNVSEPWLRQMISAGVLCFTEGQFEEDGTPVFSEEYR